MWQREPRRQRAQSQHRLLAAQAPTGAQLHQLHLLWGGGTTLTSSLAQRLGAGDRLPSPGHVGGRCRGQGLTMPCTSALGTVPLFCVQSVTEAQRGGLGFLWQL